MFQAKVVEKIKTHFMFSNFGFENRAVYEVIWNNLVQPVRPQMTILRIRIACWYLGLQTQTENMQYLLLFHGSSGYENAPQSYVCT